MSATRSNKAGNGPVFRGGPVFRFLVSVRLTIITLSLIAATSVVGSLIQQGATEEEYLERYSERVYHFIKLFGLDDAYHSPWFYFLIIIFVINLLLCTFQRLRRLTSSRERAIPDPDALLASGTGFITDPANRDEVIRRIGPSYRRRRISGNTELLEKGRFSRYGVIVIHASVFLVLIGGLIGNMAGFKAYLALRPGDEASHAESRKPGQSAVVFGFTVKCTDFQVSFYPSGQPKEYASDVEILDTDHNVLKKGRIRVNEPLSYKGIYFYQSSYGRSNTYTFTENGRKVELGDGQVARDAKVPFMVVRYAEDVHNFGPGVMVAYMDADEPKTLWFLTRVEKMRSHTVNGSTISLENISGQWYTGLEVSRDPGVPVVLLGFLMLLAGLSINFFTAHRRIYLKAGPGSLTVTGIASRNKEGFAEELKRIGGGLA